MMRRGAFSLYLLRYEESLEAFTAHLEMVGLQSSLGWLGDISVDTSLGVAGNSLWCIHSCFLHPPPPVLGAGSPRIMPQGPPVS